MPSYLASLLHDRRLGPSDCRTYACYHFRIPLRQFSLSVEVHQPCLKYDCKSCWPGSSPCGWLSLYIGLLSYHLQQWIPVTVVYLGRGPTSSPNIPNLTSSLACRCCICRFLSHRAEGFAIRSCRMSQVGALHDFERFDGSPSLCACCQTDSIYLQLSLCW